MTVNLRTSTIPPKAIILKDDTTVPEDYTYITSYNAKYLRQTPACTNPGTCIGNATHQHASAGAHTHTVSGSTAHTHTTIWAAAANCTSGGTGPGRSHISHHANHASTSGSSSPSLTTPSGDSGCHQHASSNNTPSARTYRLLQHDNYVHLRKRNLPLNTIILWSKALSLKPTHYNLDTNIYGKLVKIEACPGTSTGSNCHTHTSSNHNHTVNIATHSNHTVTISAASTNINGGGAIGTAITTHTHGIGTAAVTTNSGTANTSSPSHCHGNQSLLPSSLETALVKTSSIKIRQSGIAPKASILWIDTLASIPPGFGNSDGTIGTTNYTGKHIVGIPNGCTNPGSSIGSDTHSETTGGSHCHGTTQVLHTHGGTGTSAASCNGSTRGAAFCVTVVTSHTHGFSGLTSDGPSLTISVDSTHTHTSSNHVPVGKEIAIIEKL